MESVHDLLIGSLAVVGILLLTNVAVLLHLHRRRKEAIGKMQRELGVLNRTLLKERQELEKRDDEIGHLSGKLNEQLQANRLLGTDFHTALSDSAQSKEGMQVLRTRLAEMEAHMRVREQEVATLAGQNAELQAELEATLAEMEGLRVSMDQQVFQFENYSTSLLQVRQRLEEQLHNCQDALRRSQLELADARRTIAAMSARTSGVA
jgi:chromosome segregation ATPase